LPAKRIGALIFPAPLFMSPSAAKSLFLLGVCMLGRMGLGLLRSMNWGCQARRKLDIRENLVEHGTLLEGSPS